MAATYSRAGSENGDHIDDPSQDGLFMLIVQRQLHRREGPGHVQSRQAIRDPRRLPARGRLLGE